MNVLPVKDQARLTRGDYQKSWFAFKDKAGGKVELQYGGKTREVVVPASEDLVVNPDVF